jgi:hypothetical protein
MNDELIKTDKFYYDLTDDGTFYIETFRVDTQAMNKELSPEETYHKYSVLFKNSDIKK